MEESKGFNIKYLIIGILFTLQTVGLYDHVWNIDPNLCDMTYMWQTPEYIPVPLPSPLVTLHPRYSLYSYGEGKLATTMASGHYSGQPVLFVPGNGGSYKQVRSLASVSYRKSLDDDDETRRFDYFTADLAGDLGGLYGPALEEQTDFIAAIIPVIQRLYLTNRPVILIGHSMGGIVARAALMSETLDNKAVPLIVTLATPHSASPLPLDTHTQHFYEKVNSYWALESQLEGAVSEVTVVSVGGGRNDVQVSPLAVSSPHAQVTALTTAVPGCWASTDHQSIVWCKQLVLAIVRGLFDAIDRQTGAIHSNRKTLPAIFDYHLLTKHSGTHYVSQRHRRQLRPSASAVWVETSKRQLEYSVPAGSELTYLLIPLTGQPKHKYFAASVRVRGLHETEWIMACAALQVPEGGRRCTTGLNLSKSGRLLGGEGDQRSKMVEVLLRPLLEEGYTHLAVSVPPASDKVVVYVDVHKETDRRTKVAAPRLVYSFSPTTVLKTTPTRALVQEIVLEGLNEPWHSYELLVRGSGACSVQSSPQQPPQLWLSAHTSHMVARAPHRVSGDDFVFRVEQDEVALLPGRKDDDGEPERGDQTMQLLLEARCSYSVSVKASLPGTFRRMLLLYGSQVPAFVVCHIMLALALQCKSVADTRHCPSLLSGLLALTPVMVVPFVKISAMVLKKLEVYTDQEMLTDSGTDIAILPIFLFFSNLPLTLLVAGAAWLLVLAAGNTLHSVAVRVFGASIGVTEVVADWALSAIAKVPAAVAVALVAVACSTCGALAMVLATAFYFIFLFDLYKDHILKVLLKLIPRLQDETPPPPVVTPSTGTAAPATPATPASSADSPSSTEAPTPPAPVVPQSRESLSLHLHLTLLLLCMTVAVLQLPSLLALLSGGLTADPSLVPSVACLLPLAIIWQCNPRHEKRHYKLVGHLLHFLAVLVLVFGSISAYRLSYFVAATLTLVAVHQLFAPTVETSKQKSE